MTDDADLSRLQAEVEALRNRVREQEQTIEELQTKLEHRQDVLVRLEEQVETIDERTEIFGQITEGGASAQERRIATYLRTLHRDAVRNDGRASLTATSAWDAVNRACARTQVYSDFEQAVARVDSDRLSLVEESRASTQNTRLVLDVDAGAPIGAVAGQEIESAVRGGVEE